MTRTSSDLQRQQRKHNPIQLQTLLQRDPLRLYVLLLKKMFVQRIQFTHLNEEATSETNFCQQ